MHYSNVSQKWPTPVSHDNPNFYGPARQLAGTVTDDIATPRTLSSYFLMDPLIYIINVTNFRDHRHIALLSIIFRNLGTTISLENW